jgi:hypothetical protein
MQTTGNSKSGQSSCILFMNDKLLSRVMKKLKLEEHEFERYVLSRTFGDTDDIQRG